MSKYLDDTGLSTYTGELKKYFADKQYCDAHYRENRDDLDAILNGDKPVI